MAEDPTVPPPAARPADAPGAVQAATESDKNYVITVVLSWFLGPLGVDRFYLGKIGTGILKLVTLGGLGLWAFIDRYLIVFGVVRAKDGKRLEGYAKYGKTFKIIAGILLVLELLVIIPLMITILWLIYSGTFQSRLNDALRESTAGLVRDQVDQQFTSRGFYPSEADYMRVANREDLPVGVDRFIGSFDYQALPEGCDNQAVNCTGYILTIDQTIGDPLVLRGGSADPAPVQ